MRCILLLLDGIGDRSHASLGGQTPLQAAHTPHLDHIASQGMTGLYHAHLQGAALPSELAHFLMFGYRVEEFPGRGVVEALGEGLDIRENDVALLARVFSVSKEGQTLVLRHENPDLDRECCRIFHRAIRCFSSHGIEAEFLPAGGIAGILRLRGGVSRWVTDSNPLVEGRRLMEVAPLRAVMMTRTLPSFTDRWGLKGLLIASGAVYHGLGRVIGMESRRVNDTSDPGRDLRERLQMACRATEYDFVHVHTKVADEAGHKRDPLLKKRVIESIDQALAWAVGEIVPDDDILFLVTADHSTACSGTMIHTGETVPLVMAGKYVRRDDVKTFDEVSCASGGLGCVRGRELMYLVLNFLDRGKMWGLMDSPDDQPFTPGRWTPLRVD